MISAVFGIILGGISSRVHMYSLGMIVRKYSNKNGKFDRRFKAQDMLVLSTIPMIPIYIFSYLVNIYAAITFLAFIVYQELESFNSTMYIANRERSLSRLLAMNIYTLTTVLLLFANAYQALGEISNGPNLYAQGFFEHLYFSVITFTTLGYGDFAPQGFSRALASVQAILGFGYFGLIVGISSAIFYSKMEHE